ncbi:hypothetical protein TL16_g09888 [Triparma laevis f. inornata]|uniref:Fe2OG dioxygenase domain-containing protein n=1 Tax=Triparma laevis f. inornata TaxID=1714386 RepID=A0A9W7ENK7_9STRA|nr:hypothetical protein TL16_g09888 [Triparma laevis f. inornata]
MKLPRPSLKFHLLTMDISEVFERTGGKRVVLGFNAAPKSPTNTPILAAIYMLQSSEDTEESITQALDILSSIPSSPIPSDYSYNTVKPSKKRKSTLDSEIPQFLHPSIVSSYASLSLHLLTSSPTHLTSSLSSFPSNPSSLLRHASLLRSSSKLESSYNYYVKAYKSALNLRNLENVIIEFSDFIDLSELTSTASKSCYMSCLLGSLLSHHTSVLEHLSNFKITKRIKPSIWKCIPINTGRDVEGDCLEIRDFLPSNYLERMKEIFKPGGLFWKETGYPPTSFYSFYIRKPLKSGNVLEQVIFDIMLNRLSETYDTSKIVGGEFWAHTRSGGSSLGHQLHYDTDELRLEKEKILKHPAISSVLYLSSEGGNTLVFDDEKTYVVKPEAGKFIAFKGDRLHGVLPCKGSGRRTTFMVGFWEEEKVKGGGGRVGGGGYVE